MRATNPSSVVLEIVREMSPSGVTELRPDANLIAELGFDSLGLVELLVEVEETLDLPPLDVEAIGELECVADLERIVEEAQARMTSGLEQK